MKENIPNLELAISCKTREPRVGEVVGKDYVKLSVEEFQADIEAGKFLEYNFIHNQNYYGTRYEDVIKNGIELGKTVIKEMDILTLPYILEQKKELRPNFSYIFLDIPDEKIKERMEAR